MVFSDEQKNIIIETLEAYITELHRLQIKVTTRKNEFIEQQGNKTGSMKTDLKLLTDSELKTKIITISKLRCEMFNGISSLTFEIQKIDKEIMKRQ